VIKEGKPLPGIFVVLDGTVKVTKGRKRRATLHAGDIVGSLDCIQRNQPAEHTFASEGPLKAVFMEKEDVRRFLERNPGTSVRLGPEV
jgi:quercetin dioxygenase-like cupin family protein